MGYCANWDGSITFKTMPDKERMKALHEELCQTYVNGPTVYYSGYARYHAEDIDAVLESVAPSTESGEIYFTGDDGAHWRFVFKDDKWIEEEGYVIYESELPEGYEKD